MLEFLEYSFLRMTWLNELISKLLSLCGLDDYVLIKNALNFFLYDSIKISVFLCVLIFVISFIQSYFLGDRAKRILTAFKGIWANIIAALIGTVTPFCACSSVPLFIGFTKAGLPLGVTLSFLISSPMVDLASFMLIASIFNLKIALIYIISGLVIAVIGGTILDKLKLSAYLEDVVNQTSLSNNTSKDNKGNEKNNGNDYGNSTDNSSNASPQSYLSFTDRLSYAKMQTTDTFKKVFIYILVGVGIGALIHNVIPKEIISLSLGADNPFGVIIATIIGAPIYADIFGVIPVGEALAYKGTPIGTVLAFMMSVTTLSLPSLIMLRRAMKVKLLLSFIIVCIIGIIITGYLFNFLFSLNLI